MRSIDKLKKNKEDRKGNRQGYWEFYYTNGNLMHKGPYKNDNRDGIWEFYDKNGSLREKRLYDNGDLIKTKIYKNNNLIEINENNDN